MGRVRGATWEYAIQTSPLLIGVLCEPGRMGLEREREKEREAGGGRGQRETRERTGTGDGLRGWHSRGGRRGKTGTVVVQGLKDGVWGAGWVNLPSEYVALDDALSRSSERELLSGGPCRRRTLTPFGLFSFARMVVAISRTSLSLSRSCFYLSCVRPVLVRFRLALAWVSLFFFARDFWK